MHWNDLISARQSCRNFDTSRKVSDGVLCEICSQALLNAPSACNSQPWRIRLVTSEQKLAAAKTAFRASFMSDVSAIAVVNEVHAELMPAVTERLAALGRDGGKSEDVSQYFAEMDLGILTAHLTLAAAEHGVGSCIVGMFDEIKIREALAIPDTETPKLVVAFGFPSPTETLRVKKRKSIAETLVIQ